MDDFRLQLSCLEGQVGFIGLGNVEQGDDAAGVRLAEQLAESGLPHVVVAGTDPESFLGQCSDAGLDHLVFLDAVEFGAVAGSVVFLDGRQIETRFPQVSTHKLSLGLLAKYVEGNGLTRTWLLGVQPKSVKRSHFLSPPVNRTVDILAEAITTLFPSEARV